MNARRPPSPATLQRLKDIVGPRGWIDDAAAMGPFVTEDRGLYHGVAAAVLRPDSPAQVAALVEVCADTGTAIVPQGGNTGLCGGAVPHDDGTEVVLSLARLNRIRVLDEIENTMTVEAGCVLANIQTAAREANRLFPLSLASEGTCQIGGNLSTNAGGTAVLRYGSARDLVLGLEVVLPDGRLWEGLSGLRKDNTGYALRHLFMGAEGTLGIITAATLKLFAKPAHVATAFVGVPDVATAIDLYGHLREHLGDTVTAFEVIPRIGLEMVLKHIAATSDPLAEPHKWYVLAEASGHDGDAFEAALAGAPDSGIAADAAVAQSQTQAAALWKLRETLPEAQKFEGASIKHDVAVPVACYGEFITEASAAVIKKRAGVRVVAFGHLGDGNVHLNLSQPSDMDGAEFLAEWSDFNRIVHDIAVGMGGSFSAEHGLGQLKRGEAALYKPAVEIELMRSIKAALDPQGIMNPGKVL
jgi:D-lactate dehydrogenase (cytochrome)